MKKIFTLSLVVASAVSAFAIQPKNKQQNFVEALPEMSQVVRMADAKALDQEATLQLAPAAMTAESPYKAFYKPYGVLNYVPGFRADGFYSRYGTPLCAAPFSGAYLQGVYGDKWTNYAGSDVSSMIEDNKYEITGGINKGYYMPKIWNDTVSYYFGCDGSCASKGYAVVYTANYADSAAALMDLCNYNPYANVAIYTGFANTAAFGSREYTTTSGKKITSDKLLIQYEVPAGQNLVLDHIELPIVPSSNSGTLYTSVWDNDTLTLSAVIREKTDVEGEYKTYNATISKADLDSVGDDLRMSIYFTEDIDGFESGVSPVLRNDFSLIISGFAQEGMHLGIMMSYDKNAYIDSTGYYVSEYYTHSYYDQIVDGVSSGYYYGDARIEAIVNLVGSYYTLCDYSEGGDFNGTVPYGSKVYTDSLGTQYCIAASAVTDTATYYDFNLTTTSALEDLTITCDDPYFVDYEVDDTYFEKYNVYVLYFLTKPLAEGESEHTINGTISTDISSMNFTIKLMDANSTSLKNVSATVPTQSVIYNIMGQKVENMNAKGIYFVNGKKIMK